MASKDDGDGGAGEIFRKALNTPGDYAAFLLGTVAGVAADIASGGVSLAQGTVAGGALGLGAKKGIEATLAKRRLKRKIRELVEYYKSEKDTGRARALEGLWRKVEVVGSMSAVEIQREIDQICKP